MARPVRATRALAPGGSFICPYTSAALEPAMGLPVALSTTFKNVLDQAAKAIEFHLFPYLLRSRRTAS